MGAGSLGLLLQDLIFLSGAELRRPEGPIKVRLVKAVIVKKSPTAYSRRRNRFLPFRKVRERMGHPRLGDSGKVKIAETLCRFNIIP